MASCPNLPSFRKGAIVERSSGDVGDRVGYHRAHVLADGVFDPHLYVRVPRNTCLATRVRRGAEGSQNLVGLKVNQKDFEVEASRGVAVLAHRRAHETRGSVYEQVTTRQSGLEAPRQISVIYPIQVGG